MALRELLISFGVAVETKELKKAGGLLDEVKEHAAEFLEVLTGGAALEGIKSFIEGQVEAGAQVGNTAQRLGVTTDELQKFQYAVQSTGGTAEDANNAMTRLGRSIGSAEEGSKEAQQGFAALGIDIKELHDNNVPLNEIMAKVANNFQGMTDKNAQAQAAFKLFGRNYAPVLNALSKGQEGLEESGKEFDELGGGMSGQFVKDAKEAEESEVKLNLAFGGLKSQIAGSVLPAISKLLVWVAKMSAKIRSVVGHSNVMKLALMGLAGAAVYLAGTGLAGLATAFGEAALAAAGLEAATLPIWAIGGLIAAAFIFLIGVIEDLYTMFTGGESVIGDFLDKLFGFGTAQAVVESTKEVFNDLWGAIQEAWGAIQQLIGSFNGPDGPKGWSTDLRVVGTVLVDGIGGAIKIVLGSIQMLVEQFTHLVTLITDLKSGKGVVESLSKFGSDAASSWNKLGSKIMNVGTGAANDVAGQLDGSTQAAAAAKQQQLDALTQQFLAQMQAHPDLVPKDATKDQMLATAQDAAKQQLLQQTNNTTINIQGGNTNSQTVSAVKDELNGVYQANLREANAGIRQGM